MTQVVEKKKTLGKRECARIYKEAYEAGIIAGKEAIPTPMVVGQRFGFCRKTPFSDCDGCAISLQHTQST